MVNMIPKVFHITFKDGIHWWFSFYFCKKMEEFLNCIVNLGKSMYSVILLQIWEINGVITWRVKSLGHLNYQCYCYYKQYSVIPRIYLTCDYFAIMDSVSPQENRWCKHILSY